MIKVIAALLFSLSFSCFAQETTQDSIWQKLKFLSGSWEGKGGGEPGQGIYERSYNFIFNNKFIEVRNKSTYPPSNDNPKGEIHEDIGYISYDKLRKTFVLRQFHIEGFVNQYVLESISPDGKIIVFTSETIENIKPGWRAKETYNVNNDNEFTETFELAPPNKDFEAYSSVMLRRK